MLVASTNNEAVNVVAERCDDIAPGLLMRTGNTEALQREAAKLERLLGEPAQAPRRDRPPWAEAARHVGEEGRLLDLLRERAERAEALELPLPLLEGVWAAPGADGSAALGRWEDRARKVAGAPWWLLGPWRRGRAPAALVPAVTDEAEEGRPDLSNLPDRPSWPEWATGRPVPARLLESLADTVALEREVRALVPRHTRWDEDGLRRSRLEAAGTLLVLQRCLP